jgi:hypothetical protein
MGGRPSQPFELSFEWLLLPEGHVTLRLSGVKAQGIPDLLLPGAAPVWRLGN